MDDPLDVDLAALDRVSRLLSDSLARIDDHQWSSATPCEDWNVSGLVDHLSGGNWFTIRILSGDGVDEAMERTIEAFDGGSATRAQAIVAIDDQLGAFRATGVLGRTCHHVVGDLSGRQVLRLRLHDLIVHAWDLAEALEPPASVPAELIHWAVAELADAGSQTARHFGLGELAGVEVGGAAYLRIFGRGR